MFTLHLFALVTLLLPISCGCFTRHSNKYGIPFDTEYHKSSIAAARATTTLASRSIKIGSMAKQHLEEAWQKILESSNSESEDARRMAA